MINNAQEKMLYFGVKGKKENEGGRELLCNLNKTILLSIYNDNFIVHELEDCHVNGLGETFNAFKGHINGLNPVSIELVLKKVDVMNVKKVFVDGSNLGGLVLALKKRFTNIEITTFFHNVEARFFLGSLRSQKSIRAAGVTVVNYLAEKKSVHNSDNIICLNQRDSNLLKKLYGRGATHISPMSLEDKYSSELSKEYLSSESTPFALFVGGNFYANQAGISWFIGEVVPKIDIPIFIVGRGFEALRSELEISGKVVVIGEVDSLSDWYSRAQFVVAPIFDGSGMKTKVAEALMYGKKVIGTPEAFTGYEEITDQVGWVCSTADDFIAAIEAAQKEITEPLYSSLRELYEKNYSMMAAKKRFAEIL